MSLEIRLLDEIEQVSPEVVQVDEIPLTGKGLPFPWDQLRAGLAAVFDRPDLQLTHSATRWRSDNELLEGFGDQNRIRAVVLPPLKGYAFWVMPEQEVTLLESLLLTQEMHPVQLQDEALTESFYKFFLLEVLYQISQLSEAFPFTPVLQKEGLIPHGPCLCVDITLTCEKYHLSGRLLLTDLLRRSWVSHFIQNPSTENSLLLAKETPIAVSVVLGKVRTSMQQWQEFEVGDFLLFDQEAKKEECVFLYARQHALFRGLLEKGKIKVIEKLQYQEGLHDMGEDSEGFDEELTEDVSLTEEELSDMTDFEERKEESSFTDEETYLTDEMSEVHVESEKETSHKEEEEQGSPALGAKNATKPKEKSLSSLQDLPLSIHVEVGCFEMSIEKFLQIEPGNLLPLEVRPEDGVYLTIHGKPVAKGELIRLGDLLGVRIVHLAEPNYSKKPL